MPKTDYNHCQGCKKSWDEVTRAVRARIRANGNPGDPLPRCTDCHDKRNNSGKSGKRKRDVSEDSDDDESCMDDMLKVAGLAELDTELQKLAEADWKEFKAEVTNIDCDSDESKAFGYKISSLIYRHTGYKYT
jgi:hypothetical protein